jgi:hypothetical protein
MRYGDNRDRYNEEIALCTGFDSVFDLPDRIQDLLRIISPDRLETILQVAEAAASNGASYVAEGANAEKLDAIEKMARAHVDNKNAKVRELMEEILVIIGEEPEQPSVDNYTYDTQPVEELNVS